jgi:hypothetical protein
MSKIARVKIEVEGEQQYKQALGDLVMQRSIWNGLSRRSSRACWLWTKIRPHRFSGNLDIRDKIEISKYISAL